MTNNPTCNAIAITLPDGSVRTFSGPVSVLEVSASIGAQLARNTVAGIVNGRLVDASDMIDCDASLQIITPNDPQGVEIIRHSSAHLIGSVIDEGFYYDITYERPFTQDDLAAIEARMRILIAKGLRCDQAYDAAR